MSLINAAQRNDIDLVRQLVDSGSDINMRDDYGMVALLFASHLGYTGMVELLLNSGADPNIRDINGMTSLILGSLYGRTEMIKLLLNSGADPNMQGLDGMTAVMFASSNGDTEVVELLLNSGADPFVEDDYGETALMMAIKEGHTDIVKLLEDTDTDVFDSPSSPDKQQLREEAAIRIQRRARGRRTRRKLTKTRQRYGKMATPTTEREKMRRWTDLTKMYLDDDPIRGYEQFSIYPEWLLPIQTNQLGGYRRRSYQYY